jgi:heme exporter protein CcmD
MDLAAPHMGYVLIAYAITAAVLAALVAAIALDHARRKRDIARLDAGGTDARPRRRAAPAKETP